MMKERFETVVTVMRIIYLKMPKSLKPVCIRCYELLYYQFSRTAWLLLPHINKNHHRTSVMTFDETLDSIKKCSCIRFGDGEFTIISGNDIPYQKYNKNLADAMIQILSLPQKEGVIVCIPDIYNKFENYDRITKYFWSSYRVKRYWLIQHHTFDNYYYGNAFATRPYIGLNQNERKKSTHYFKKLREVWEGKDVVIVEGNTTRNGVGNDLFNNTSTLRRIIGPSKNAYSKYSELLDACLDIDKDVLILISLGPAGKVLAWDLYLRGYHVIDVGHIDSEYEWYLHHVKKRSYNINNNKHQAEKDDDGITECYDLTYHSQIITNIR